MDTHTIVTWSIIILTTLSLVVFFRIRSKNKENKKLSVLRSFASENNCTISIYDHWDNTMIGLDKKEGNMLFFIRATGDKEVRKAIDLSQVSNCQLYMNKKDVKYHTENIIVFDKIELEFTFSKAQKPNITLEFYNSNSDNLTLSGELQIAQKWLEIINSTRTNIQKSSKKVSNSNITGHSDNPEPAIKDLVSV